MHMPTCNTPGSTRSHIAFRVHHSRRLLPLWVSELEGGPPTSRPPTLQRGDHSPHHKGETSDTEPGSGKVLLIGWSFFNFVSCFFLSALPTLPMNQHTEADNATTGPKCTSNGLAIDQSHCRITGEQPKACLPPQFGQQFVQPFNVTTRANFDDNRSQLDSGSGTLLTQAPHNALGITSPGDQE